jgi:hypothetical protein
MEMIGQPFVLATQFSKKNPHNTHSTLGWVGSSASSDSLKKRNLLPLPEIKL